MEKIYTDYLEERIYSANNRSKTNVLIKELTEFFQELVRRKRNDEVEDGLQAGIVIYSNAFAAKVNEADGTALHMNTNINLTKFLRHDNQYITPYGTQFTDEYRDALQLLHREGTEIRILDSKDKLMLLITSANKIQTIFELKVLRIILDLCRMLLVNKEYQEVEVGMHTPDIEVESASYPQIFGQVFAALDNKSSRMMF